MADVSITASQVVYTSGEIEVVTAGGTVTAGQPVYKNTSNANKVVACDADVAASAVCAGVSLCNASNNQPCVILKRGFLDIGGGLTTGAAYYVSTTAGGIAPFADLLAGDFVTQVGIATADDTLHVDINVTGTAIPA